MALWQKVEAEFAAERAWSDTHVKQVSDLLHALSKAQEPTAEDRAKRQAIIDGLKQHVFVLGKWRGFSTEPYGSFVSGFYTATSDLDLALTGSMQTATLNRDSIQEMFPDGKITEHVTLSQLDREMKIQLLKLVCRKLERERQMIGAPTRILAARVPIIKFTHPSGVECDICVGNDGVSFKGEVLRLLSAIDDRLLPLYHLVKLWAKTHDVNDATEGTFNSWSLTLLVVFHLQTRERPVLPPLWRLFHENPPDHREPRFLQANCRMTRAVAIERCKRVAGQLRGFGAANKETVLELFSSFFVCYKGIMSNWAAGKNRDVRVCPWMGKFVTGKYSKPYLMPVEDPFDNEDNTARSVGCETTERGTADYIAYAFDEATKLLRKLSSQQEMQHMVAWFFGLEGLGLLPHRIGPTLSLNNQQVASLLSELRSQLMQRKSGVRVFRRLMRSVDRPTDILCLNDHRQERARKERLAQITQQGQQQDAAAALAAAAAAARPRPPPPGMQQPLGLGMPLSQPLQQQQQLGQLQQLQQQQLGQLGQLQQQQLQQLGHQQQWPLADGGFGQLGDSGFSPLSPVLQPSPRPLAPSQPPGLLQQLLGSAQATAHMAQQQQQQQQPASTTDQASAAVASALSFAQHTRPMHMETSHHHLQPPPASHPVPNMVNMNWIQDRFHNHFSQPAPIAPPHPPTQAAYFHPPSTPPQATFQLFNHPAQHTPPLQPAPGPPQPTPPVPTPALDANKTQGLQSLIHQMQRAEVRPVAPPPAQDPLSALMGSKNLDEDLEQFGFLSSDDPPLTELTLPARNTPPQNHTPLRVVPPHQQNRTTPRVANPRAPNTPISASPLGPPPGFPNKQPVRLTAAPPAAPTTRAGPNPPQEMAEKAVAVAMGQARQASARNQPPPAPTANGNIDPVTKGPQQGAGPAAVGPKLVIPNGVVKEATSDGNNSPASARSRRRNKKGAGKGEGDVDAPAGAADQGRPAGAATSGAGSGSAPQGGQQAQSSRVKVVTRSAVQAKVIVDNGRAGMGKDLPGKLVQPVGSKGAGKGAVVKRMDALGNGPQVLPNGTVRG